MTSRQGEADQTRFRSDRFFCEGDKWFFMAREGAIRGPYDSRDDAEQELTMYLRDLQQRSNFGVSADS